MHLPDPIARRLADPRTRLVLGIGAAFLWFALIVSAETYRGSVFPVFYAVPAALILLYWRARPWVALGLALLTLVVVLFGAGNGVSVNAGGLMACATAWFAVLGASLADEERLRWAGGALLGLEALLALGNSGLPGFLGVAALGGLAPALAWAWRRRGSERALTERLDESTRRGDEAERDVLVELERNRIAREVHDVVAHSLAVVIAQADGARFAAGTKPETVVPALEAIGDTARRALGEVRTMLHDLRTSGEGAVPGADDLDALVDGVRELGVPVRRDVWGEPAALDRAAGLALYRIAQEALTNAMRHGDREEPIGFELDWGARQVVLIVTNAVTGGAPAATERPGQGLVGMCERAADAGGDCAAGPGSNGRFRVRVVLPVAAPEPDPPVQPATDPLSVLVARLDAATRA